VLDACKAQPRLVKRFAQPRSVEAVTPIWLQKFTWVEALLFLYFCSLLIQALLEHQLRQAMTTAGLDQLPVYPDARECRAPGIARVLEVFAVLQWHGLWVGQQRVKTFQPALDDLQRESVEVNRRIVAPGNRDVIGVVPVGHDMQSLWLPRHRRVAVV
jgi:hypothetical protein